MASRSNAIDKIFRKRETVKYCDDESSEEDEDDWEVQEESKSKQSLLTKSFEESEQDLSEEGPSTSTRKRSIVYGKNKYKRSVSVPERDRRSSLTILPSAIGLAANARSPLEVWSTLFTENILETILQYTNEEIDRYKSTCSQSDTSTTRNLTMIELRAFLGLMYLSGVRKDNYHNYIEEWSSEFGCVLYRSTMSAGRFEFICSQLRFDDKNTRTERKKTDGLAPVRDIWDMFINNCQRNYTPSRYLTIDEQLLDFSGRFSSKVFMKSKPARYGIKLVTLNDAKTFYLYNAIPYAGKVDPPEKESVPSYYVRKLCEPIYGTSRNVTCDNWFTSVEIFTKMLKDHNITMVGTIRKNKRHVPESFKRTASVGTTRYGYVGNNILLSWCPKKDKMVLVLSSLHKSEKKNAESGKPEIIDFYNKTKVGTDVFDQRCASYSCAKKTNRWSTRFFMGMLDQAAVNSHILYNFIAAREMRYRQFLKQLLLSLIIPHLQERKNIPSLSKIIKMNILDILGENEKSTTTLTMSRSGKLVERKSSASRCSLCPSKFNKTTVCCENCEKLVCEEHQFFYCVDCSK